MPLVAFLYYWIGLHGVEKEGSINLTTRAEDFDAISTLRKRAVDIFKGACMVTKDDDGEPYIYQRLAVIRPSTDVIL